MRLMENAGSGDSARRKVAGVKESLAYGKNPNPQPALSRSAGEGPPDLLSDQQQSWERTQSAF